MLMALKRNFKWVYNKCKQISRGNADLKFNGCENYWVHSYCDTVCISLTGIYNKYHKMIQFVKIYKFKFLALYADQFQYTKQLYVY